MLDDFSGAEKLPNVQRSMLSYVAMNRPSGAHGVPNTKNA
jgi:hypothetical protein